MATIGFVGTGIMGLPMAMHLLKAGHQIKVWNRTLSKADSLKKLVPKFALTLNKSEKM